MEKNSLIIDRCDVAIVFTWSEIARARLVWAMQESRRENSVSRESEGTEDRLNSARGIRSCESHTGSTLLALYSVYTVCVISAKNQDNKTALINWIEIVNHRCFWTLQ